LNEMKLCSNVSYNMHYDFKRELSRKH
jgi:hypothetical protein